MSFFCRELRCVPDIWSLVEWSDWLTPRNMGRRYDAVFYLCCCETTPPISADGTEVVDAKVCVHVYVHVWLCVLCVYVWLYFVCGCVIALCVCMCDCVLCVHVCTHVWLASVWSVYEAKSTCKTRLTVRYCWESRTISSVWDITTQNDILILPWRGNFMWVVT